MNPYIFEQLPRADRERIEKITNVLMEVIDKDDTQQLSAELNKLLPDYYTWVDMDGENVIFEPKLSQSADTITRVWVVNESEPDELIYECRGYTNLQELEAKCKEAGYVDAFIKVDKA